MGVRRQHGELVSALNPYNGGVSLIDAAAVNGELYFALQPQSGGSTVEDRRNIESGTQLFANPSTGGTISGLTLVTNIGGTIFFAGTDSVSGYGLFRSDGTSAGTKLLLKAAPGDFYGDNIGKRGTSSISR